jgi:hypothetical protein
MVETENRHHENSAEDYDDNKREDQNSRERAGELSFWGQLCRTHAKCESNSCDMDPLDAMRSYASPRPPNQRRDVPEQYESHPVCGDEAREEEPESPAQRQRCNKTVPTLRLSSNHPLTRQLGHLELPTQGVTPKGPTVVAVPREPWSAQWSLFGAPERRPGNG